MKAFSKKQFEELKESLESLNENVKNYNDLSQDSYDYLSQFRSNLIEILEERLYESTELEPGTDSADIDIKIKADLINYLDRWRSQSEISSRLENLRIFMGKSSPIKQDFTTTELEHEKNTFYDLLEELMESIKTALDVFNESKDFAAFSNMLREYIQVHYKHLDISGYHDEVYNLNDFLRRRVE